MNSRTVRSYCNGGGGQHSRLSQHSAARALSLRPSRNNVAHKCIVSLVLLALASCGYAPHRAVTPPVALSVEVSTPLPRAIAQSEFVLRDEQTVVGEIEIIRAAANDTLPDIARRFNLGYEEIIRANPGLNPWGLKAGTEVVLPTRFVLPAAPHEGVVVDVALMRLFYYPPHKANEPQRVLTYPIGIGKLGWKTPEGSTKITAKVKDPYWNPPSSVRQEHLENDDPLPNRVPPGPDNPLGAYLFRLGWPGYLIHGTNKPYGVGMRASHGCVRLYPEDIAALFPQLPVGTPVQVVNQPYRFGVIGQRIELQAVEPLEDDRRHWQAGPRALLAQAKHQPNLRYLMGLKNRIDWDYAQRVAQAHRGIVVAVTSNATQTVAEQLKQAKRVDNDIPIGAHWNGVMDLSDDEQAFRSLLMERARSQP
jgi:L,D-transpeptidase ErfK/SrfK